MSSVMDHQRAIDELDDEIAEQIGRRFARVSHGFGAGFAIGLRARMLGRPNCVMFQQVSWTAIGARRMV